MSHLSEIVQNGNPYLISAPTTEPLAATVRALVGFAGETSQAASLSYVPGTPANWSPVPTTIGGALDTLATKPYAAGTPANWAGAAPTNYAAAIDRLAAAVAGLLGGPIP